MSRPDAETTAAAETETETETEAAGRGATLSLTPAPDREEAAAVAAAVGACLADRARLAAVASEADDHDDDRAARWRLAGRQPAPDRRPVRLRRDAPGDPWTAAGRRDRR